MGVMGYFKPVSTWTAQKVREFISENDEGEYDLVDVRQPAEYERGHLPGARLIPVGQLRPFSLTCLIDTLNLKEKKVPVS